jgi:hypothetical protein
MSCWTLISQQGFNEPRQLSFSSKPGDMLDAMRGLATFYERKGYAAEFDNHLCRLTKEGQPHIVLRVAHLQTTTREAVTTP